MNLKNTGWAFAVYKGKSGVVPLNYLVINKNKPITSNPEETLPVPRPSSMKTHRKRVSFGENQIFENVDIDDYVLRKEPSVSSHAKKDKNLDLQTTKEKSETDVSKSVEDQESKNVKNN